jgi:hypothetical protein
MRLRIKMQTGALIQSYMSPFTLKMLEREKLTRCDKDYNIVLSSHNLTNRLQRIYINERQVTIITLRLRMFAYGGKGCRLASLFNRSLIIKASLASERVTEEQDERKKAEAGDYRKEPEDGLPIKGRRQYSSKYGSKSLGKDKSKIAPSGYIII